jgi:hypothetical protein
MKEVRAMVRGYGRAGLAAAVLACAVSACSQSTPATGASGVTCTNYAIHASGKYHYEVWVRVEVNNTTAQPARYAIDVALNVRHTQQAAVTAAHVTLNGLVAGKTSTELGRKVLTTDVVQRCRVTKLSRS